jgi:crotonobetainyl-CoA:carnitine CoA-transferase CaiB-like acyl-CoA transferase
MGALSHIRVLDLSRVLAGPWCSQNLADLGADVIKVERPKTGDESRNWGPPFAKDSHGNETAESTYFISANRNKRSITVDISTSRGQDIIRKLVAQCDVLIENYKVGDLAKYGLDYDSLKQAKNNLIYCSISGFGQTGPYALRPGYDFITQGMGGLMSITGEAEDVADSSPQKTGVAIADLFTGMYATSAILAAIVHRDHTGEGQYIDISILDSQVAMMANISSAYLNASQLPKRIGNASSVIVPYQTFPTADGWMIVAAGNDHQYRQFVTAGDQAQLADDPRFLTNPLRVSNRELLIPLLEKMTRQKTKSAWIELLEKAKVPCGPINNVKEVFDDEQVLSRNLLKTLSHPTIGSLKIVNSPMRLSKTPPEVRLPPPVLGQHTEEILRTYLNFGQNEIEDLRAAGII